MTTPAEPKPPRLSLESLERIDQICTRFEEALRNGERPAIEELIRDCGGPERRQLLLELLLLDLAHHLPAEIDELRNSYESRFPSDRPVVRKAIRKHRQLLGRQEAERESVTFEEYPTRESVSVQPAGIPRRLRYLEDYELLEEIARGGMGVVYKARDRRDNRSVAIKMLLLGEHATAEQSERFVREARTAARLSHPNIIPVYEVGYRDSSPYFVMDYIDGQDLETLRQHQPVSDVQAAHFVKTAARAIAYAHESGVLHRDLKPSNLLVDEEHRLRITDFGLAKMIGRDESLTRTGEIMGTPGFMPPEQASGKRTENQIGFASDVYGLGAVLYYLLTGRPPHQGDSVIEVIDRVLKSEPPAPRSINREISPELEAICLKCLQKKPENRYPSAAALADDLGNWLLDKPIQATRRGTADGSRRFLKQFAVSFAATAVCLLIAGFLIHRNGWFSSGHSNSPVQTNAENQPEHRQVAAANREPDAQDVSGTDPPPRADLIPLRAPKPKITIAAAPPKNPPTNPGPIPAQPQPPILPGGLLGPLFKPSWTDAPSETRGMAVVHNMEDFSDKLDYFAELIGRDPPHVLQAAMDQAQIHAGLKQDGSLLWLAGKSTTDGTPLVYLLPATRFEEMIGRLNPQQIKPPHKLRGYHRVQVGGWNYLSKPTRDHGLFVEEPWSKWADQIAKSPGGFDRKLGSFDGYLRRQDIGFVLTREAIAEGITIGLPFQSGDYIVPKSMQQLTDLFFDLSGFTCMGGGTRLTPLTGITVSGAAAIDPQSPAARWHQSMPYRHRDLLRGLPADASALVIAGNSCKEWNQGLEDLCLHEFGRSIDFSGLQAVSLQIAARPDSAALSELFHAQIKAADAHKFFADLQQFLPVIFQQEIARNEIAIRTDPQPHGRVLRLWIKPELLKWWFAENGYDNFCLAMTVLDKHTIVIQGVHADYLSDQVQGKVSLAGVIAQLQQQTVSLIDDPKMQTTLNMIYPDSQQVLLLDLFGAAVSLQEILKHGQAGGTQSGGYANIAMIFAGFFQNSPPLGMSNRLTSEMIELDVVAPKDLLKPLAEMGLFR